MDPKFQQRWVEVRRAEGRRRLAVLVGVTVVTALGLAGWGATASPLLDLDRVVVAGAAHTAADDVRFASGLRLHEPLVDVDEAAVARSVERLPWVDSASVRLRWPGEVRIDVVEREPVALIASEGGPLVLVDRTGRVLEELDGPPPALPVLTGLVPAGPPGSVLAPDGVAALSVAVALPAELRARTSGVAPTDGGRGEVEIRLRPDGSIRLGLPVDLDRKFDAVRAVLAQVDVSNLAILDVRRPDSPVLTRREPPTKVSTPRVG